MREKVAVLMGGRSLERDVSLRSGERVCAALTGLGYRVLGLDVTSDLVSTLRAEQPDACYVALHGRYGEDGTIQELLEFLGIPYTGPGVTASSLAWDKAVSKRLFAQAGIPTPAWVAFTADAFKDAGAATALDLVAASLGGYPLVVKPAEQGSALGLTKLASPVEMQGDAGDSRGGVSHTPAPLAEALLDALSYGDKALVEKWVDGAELAVSVLGAGSDMRVLPPVEIEAKSGLFDFNAMYTMGETDYFVPARLAPEVLSRTEELARSVHALLGCRGVSRVDMVAEPDGAVWVLECNTCPGMTETSLLPMAAEAAGVGFDELVETILRDALDRVR